ncbi:hypothetical protein C9J85_02210 [Haloferax sp. wsp5]|nr:hypothetical protein C9J85_02210 [Haloferax sp. wsp5]
MHSGYLLVTIRPRTEVGVCEFPIIFDPGDVGPVRLLEVRDDRWSVPADVFGNSIENWFRQHGLAALIPVALPEVFE